jgi:hypothetical protein
VKEAVVCESGRTTRTASRRNTLAPAELFAVASEDHKCVGSFRVSGDVPSSALVLVVVAVVGLERYSGC